MNVELKRVHSPDVYDLESFEPDDAKNFGFLLQVMVGPEGGEGEESFDIEICTPSWLEENYGLDDVVIGRHHMIVQQYSYKKLIQVISDLLKECSGADWNEAANKISRFGMWEFEDYEAC